MCECVLFPRLTSKTQTALKQADDSAEGMLLLLLQPETASSGGEVEQAQCRVTGSGPVRQKASAKLPEEKSTIPFVPCRRLKIPDTLLVAVF